MSWLEPLLDPWPLIARARGGEGDDPRIGLALLLQGQFRLYRSLAARDGWPAIGEPARARADAGRRLLGALALHFVGDERAPQEYRRVLRSRDKHLKAIAAVSASIYYRDTGRHRDKVEVLRKTLPSIQGGAATALLWIHIGVRAAEEGAWHDAVAATGTASSQSLGADIRAWRDQLDWIAAHNLLQFNWRLHRIPSDPLNLPSRSSVPALLRADSSLVDPLAHAMHEQFEAVFADAQTRTLVLSTEDLAESQLQGTLIHADWTGDWHEIAQARRLLGRYQLLARLRSRQLLPASSLELLRLAGDDKSVRAAARTMARGGPLNSLQEATADLVATWSVHSEPNASLVLLSEGADSMTAENADVAAMKLMSDPVFFVENWAEAPQALAAVTRACTSQKQTAVATFTLRMLEEHPQHAALVQSLQQVVDAIDWGFVEARVRRQWLAYAKRDFRSGTSTQLAAARALHALADSDLDHVRKFVFDEVEAAPDLQSVALATAVAEKLPSSLRVAAFTVVTESLDVIREQAANGSWGIGGFDVAALCVLLLRQWPDESGGWSSLVDFLLDPQVGVNAKSGALSLLADRAFRLPPTPSATLRAALPTLEGVVDAFASPEEFEGAKLRLGVRLRAFSREESIARFVQLSAGSPVARIEAAHSLRGSERIVGREFIVAIALRLASDEHHEVRAAAGYALPGIRLRARDEALIAMTKRRVRELLAEQGALIPLAVLSGLSSVEKPANMREFQPQVQQIRENHPSHAVRRAARDLLVYLAQSGSKAR